MSNPLAFILFIGYMIVIAALSFLGSKKTKSALAFITGNGNMGMPVVVLSLASSFTSAATLMAMPGYIYQSGLSGIVYFNIFQTLGLMTGLVVVGKKVRAEGLSQGAASIPQWLRNTYKSKSLGYFFAIQSIFLITFMVLILMLMGDMISGISTIGYKPAVILIGAYVFIYSLVGGSYGHGWTALVQSIIMIVIVVFIIFSAMPDAQIWQNFSQEIVKQDPYYFNIVNPNSILFKDYFTVIYCAFIMGFCNIFQPHIFNKALYLKKEKSWGLTTVLSIAVISIFNLILIVGMFIRIKYPEITNYDTLMNYYIVNNLGKVATAFMFVTVMAAAMSTLNGVIIGMCSNISSELIPQTVSEKKSLFYVHSIVAVVGVVVIVLSLNPPNLLGVIGMWGYNVLMSASFVPMICSLWFKKVSVVSIFASSITAIVLFLILMASKITINGAWACGWCIPASIVAAMISEGIIHLKKSKNK